MSVKNSGSETTDEIKDDATGTPVSRRGFVHYLVTAPAALAGLWSLGLSACGANSTDEKNSGDEKSGYGYH